MLSQQKYTTESEFRDDYTTIILLILEVCEQLEKECNNEIKQYRFINII